MTEVNSQDQLQDKLFDIATFDIAIVGGGIVGLSLALALADTALSIVIIDNQASMSDVAEFKLSFDPRVSALTVASQKLFAELKVWQEIQNIRACPYDKMFVWDADGTGSIQFSASSVRQNQLGFITENRLITAGLNTALLNQENIHFIRPRSLIEMTQEKDGKHLLRLNKGECIRCNLLVGADGGNSVVRKQGGFTCREWDYGHQAIVATVKTEMPHQNTARQRFMLTGPLAFLPLAALESNLNIAEKVEQRDCSIVWSCVPEFAEELMQMEDKKFAEVLGKAFEHKLGKIEFVGKRFSFPLKQKHANDYVNSGVAIIGDAAHVIHPLAGQGVNLGLLDVVSLVSVIKVAIARGEDYASLQTLSRYQRERKGQNLGMMMVMEGFKRIFGSDDLYTRWMRNLGLKGVDNSDLVKNQIMLKAMGL